MTSYEITCIKMSGGLLQSHQDNITHIGYKNELSITRVITIQQAIQMLQNGQCTFYVQDKLTQDQIPVVIVNRGLLGKNPYLRTIANGVEKDNLEQLPECRN